MQTTRGTTRQHLLSLVSLLVALVTAINAQNSIAAGAVAPGVMLYLFASGCLLIGTAALPPRRYNEPPLRALKPLERHRRIVLGVVALAAGVCTFALSGGNRYTWFNVPLWLCSIVCWWAACADVRAGQWWNTPRAAIARMRRRVRHARATFIWLGAILVLGAAFRLAYLDSIPYEMNRDHVANLVDIRAILAGSPSIFFAENTGREGLQFYLTAALVRLFGLYPDFMALKLTTVLIGLLMLPAVFLLGREVFNTRTALLATFFAAVASWGVLTARYGLRNPLAPCAVAWTFAMLVPGLKYGSRNAMLGAGLWMGIGLQGYTAFRFMLPVVALLGGGWVIRQYVRRQPERARRALLDGVLALVLALLVVMPLLRYMADAPDEFLSRAVTRITDEEKPIEGHLAAIFANNLQRALLMFNYISDPVWVVSIPFKPEMDAVMGALLVLGVVGVVVLGVRRRDPWPPVVLVAGVLMLMPSVLSLAFPGENPSAMRTSGALPLLMLVCAVVPGMLLDVARRGTPTLLRQVSLGALTLICAAVVTLNSDRVLYQYPAGYCPRITNHRDMANELRDFIQAGHSRRNAWVIEYERWWWVDPRQLGIWTGNIDFPRRVLGTEQINDIDLQGQPGWFLLHVDDKAALELLQARYPQGVARLFRASHCPEVMERRFVIFTTQAE